MTAELLCRARAGDREAFTELVEPFRPELRVHCYLILGSVQDAEDALAETMVTAWREIDRLDDQTPVRAWLYRIATNTSLNALRETAPRPEPDPGLAQPEPAHDSEPLWLEPFPDELLGDLTQPAPESPARYAAAEAVSLPFLTALQHLPPMQRAVLIITDVLGFTPDEAAWMLQCDLDTVGDQLARARGGLGGELPDDRERPPVPGSAREHDLVARFTEACARDDAAGIADLLAEDARLTMPPLPFQYQGRAATGEFLKPIFSEKLSLVPTRANGQPAFGCYLRDDATSVGRADGLIVLTLAGDQIAEITRFLDSGVMPRFGLPRVLREGS